MARSSSRLSIIIVALLAAPALAQEQAEPLAQLEDRGRAPTRAQLAAAATLQARFAGTRVSWDPATGCPRSVHLARPVRIPARDTEGAVRFVFQRLGRLYAGQLKLRTRQGPPRAADGPYLARTDVVTVGPTRIVTFEQRVGAVPVDGSKLRVVLARREGRTVLRSVSGRVFADVPVLVGPQPALPPAPAGQLGKLRLDVGRPQVVLTPLPDGEWRYAVSSVELPGAFQPEGVARVLRDARGQELARHPLGQTEGWVTGPVVGDDGTAQQPLADLFVRSGGRTVTTDGEGTFPGDSGSLPLGLTGRRIRVANSGAGALPSGQRITIGNERIDETNVYYHLGAIRDWLRQTYPSLPRRAVDARILAVVGLGDYRNASNLSLSAQDGGESYDHVHAYGFYSDVWASRKPTTVTHERAHALFNDLGLEYAGMTPKAVHEGTADYMAAIRLNTAKMTTRDLDVLKVWPEDARSSSGWGESHAVGWIWGGALWDSRKALPQAKRTAFDMAVFEMIPTVTPASTLLDARDGVLAGVRARGFSREEIAAVVAQFERHGIGNSGRGQPPIISATPASALHNIVIVPGQPQFYTLQEFLGREDVKVEDLPTKLVFEARDPDGKPVELTFSYAPDMRPTEFSNHGDVVVTSGETARVEWTLHDERTEPGHYYLQLIAEDADGEQSRIFIDLWSAYSEQWVNRGRVHTAVHVDPDERKRVQLRPLLDEGGRYELQDDYDLPDWVRVRSSDLELSLRPSEEEVGVHVLSVAAKAKSDHRTYDVHVTAVVGEGPFLEVYESTVLPKTRGKKNESGLAYWMNDVEHLRDRLPEGQPLSVRAGTTLEVVVAGFGDPEADPVELSVEQPVEHVTLEPVDPAPRVRRVELSEVPGARAGLLAIRPPAGTEGLWRIPLVATSGERQVRRVLEVFVHDQPSDNQPPGLVAPREVALAAGGIVTFPVLSRDPDDDPVRVELLGAVGDTLTITSEGQRHWQGLDWYPAVEGTVTVRQAGRIHLRATDRRGLVTLHAVDVKPGPEDLDPARGLTDGLDDQRPR